MFSASSYPQSILREGRRREIMRSIKVSDQMVERPATSSARCIVAKAAAAERTFAADAAAY